MKTLLWGFLFLSTFAFSASIDATRVVNKIGIDNCDITAEGYNCFVTIGIRRVDIIVPQNYQSGAKCIVHFHGLRIRDEDIDKRETIEWFHFEKGLQNAAPNTLMIAPVGTYGQYNYSLASDYGSLAKLNALVGAAETISGESCNEITLSGHSAAYRVMTPLLTEINTKPSLEISKQINHVFLFDALYSSSISAYTQWLKSPNHFIDNVARKGQGTDGNSNLIPKQSRYINLISAISDHWNLVRDRYFQQFLTY